MKIQYISYKNINKEIELKKTKNTKKPTTLNIDSISNVYYQPISFNGGYLTDRAQFLKLKGNIIPDKYQEEAMKAISRNEAVLVEAPTGTGKTLIGEYAIHKNLNQNKRTFYTTPLKALTNQKYNDFKRIFGKNKVGIATGDLKENLDAPIVVMTTEIYRNMLNPVDMNKNKLLLHDIGNVIFDEFHYMNDLERGRVWEESIMFTPENVKPIMLSATMSNADLLSRWHQDLHPEVIIKEVNVSAKDRHVPLNYVGYTANSSRKFTKLFYGEVNLKKLLNDFTHNKLTERQVKALEEFTKAYDINEKLANIRPEYKNNFKNRKPDKIEIKYNLEKLIENIGKPVIEEDNLIQRLVHKMDRETIKKTLPYFVEDGEKKTSFKLNYIEEPETVNQEITKVIHNLKRDDMLPAISFIFSKVKCDNLVSYYQRNGEDLLSEAEKNRLEMILDEYEARTPALSQHYNRKALLKGVAMHHAGLLPGYKKVIERLFQEGLVKVVFATETLAAGINMPAKTVVFSSMEKPTGQGGKDQLRPLTSSEFQQMAGRAGRRGYDDIGNVVIMQTQIGDFDIANSLANSPPVEIESNFRPSYSLLCQIFDEIPDEKYIDTIIEKSFLKYTSEIPDKLKDEFALTIDMLEEKGYIKKEGGLTRLTEKGNLIKNIRSTNEMLLAEIIDQGLLFELDPASLTAVVSSLVHESDKDEINFEIPSNDSLEIEIEETQCELESKKLYLIEEASKLGIKSNSIDDIKEKIKTFKINDTQAKKVKDKYNFYTLKAKIISKLTDTKIDDDFRLFEKSISENNFNKAENLKERILEKTVSRLQETSFLSFEKSNGEKADEEIKKEKLDKLVEYLNSKKGISTDISQSISSITNKELKQKIKPLLDVNKKSELPYERRLQSTLARLNASNKEEDIKKLKKINSYLDQIELNQSTTTDIQPYNTIKFLYDDFIEKYPKGIYELKSKIENQKTLYEKTNQEQEDLIQKYGGTRQLNKDNKTLKQKLIKILDNGGKKKYEACLSQTLKRLEHNIDKNDLKILKEAIKEVEFGNNPQSQIVLDGILNKLWVQKEKEKEKEIKLLEIKGVDTFTKETKLKEIEKYHNPQNIEKLKTIYTYIFIMQNNEEKQNKLKQIENTKTQNWQSLNKLESDLKNFKIISQAKEQYEYILEKLKDKDYNKEAQKLKNKLDKSSQAQLLLSEIKNFNDKKIDNMVKLQNLAISERDAVDETKIVEILEKIYKERQDINNLQETKGIESIPKAIFNSCLATHMYKWANVSDNLSEEEWNNIVKSVINSTDIEFEGEFYRSINLTVDILKQIMAICSFDKIRNYPYEKQAKFNELFQSASQAIDMLKKPPIYEPVEDYEI